PAIPAVECEAPLWRTMSATLPAGPFAIRSFGGYEESAMSFSPLIHPDHIQSRVNQYAASPAISELLTRCFDSDILPSRASHPRRLLRSEVFADLYTSEREWHDPVDFDPGGVDRHENYLDHIFWDARPAPRRDPRLVALKCASPEEWEQAAGQGKRSGTVL